MQTAKEKLSNMASAAKEHIKIYKAKAQEKAEKAVARTKEKKEIAHERRKTKEAEAKMEYHAAKARHKARKLNTGAEQHRTFPITPAFPAVHASHSHPPPHQKHM